MSSVEMNNNIPTTEVTTEVAAGEQPTEVKEKKTRKPKQKVTEVVSEVPVEPTGEQPTEVKEKKTRKPKQKVTEVVSEVPVEPTGEQPTEVKEKNTRKPKQKVTEVTLENTGEQPPLITTIYNDKSKLKNLPAKDIKLMVFGFWLTNILNQNGIIHNDNLTNAHNLLNLFTDIQSQSSFFNSFDNQFKDSLKLLKNTQKNFIKSYKPSSSNYNNNIVNQLVHLALNSNNSNNSYNSYNSNNSYNSYNSNDSYTDIDTHTITILHNDYLIDQHFNLYHPSSHSHIGTFINNNLSLF